MLEHVRDINITVYNFFARNTGKFTDVYLNQLATRELSMLRDRENVSYLFFENTIIEVKKDSIKYIKYVDCGGLVWKKNIIPYSYSATNKATDFEQFILNVSNQDPARKNILEIAMGYLLTTYKKQNLSFYVGI